MSVTHDILFPFLCNRNITLLVNPDSVNADNVGLVLFTTYPVGLKEDTTYNLVLCPVTVNQQLCE